MDSGKGFPQHQNTRGNGNFSPPSGSREDEDDFLCGETPQTEGIMGMTPSSYDSNLRSPSSVGSPPIAFQRPF